MSSGPLPTSGWHTPVPGPSGETLWQTDWNRDSPARQTVNNRWSPSSSPGTSGLNGRAGLERTVTISSSNSSVSPQTTLVDIEPTTNYQASNASSDSIGRSNRKRSSKVTIVEKTRVETEKKHPYHHYHRNSHKHKRKRKESKRSSEKHTSGKLCGDTNHVDNGSRESRSRSRGSQSQKSRSREARSRNSHSQSRDSRNSRSNSQSRYFSRACTSLPSRTHHSVSRSRSSSLSTANSEPNVRESASHSNDAIKREIEDLESRIVADKKRLLRLLMKKEQAETA